MGYYDFYKTLFEDVGVMMTAGLAKFFNTKQKRKIAKRTYKRRLEVKMARSKSQKKQEIYKERTDKSYGHAVALPEVNRKKRKQNTKDALAVPKKCRCGSETHQRTTHKDCSENPKNKQLKGVTGSSLKTPLAYGHAQFMCL
jgi:hypothetical protein